MNDDKNDQNEDKNDKSPLSPEFGKLLEPILNQVGAVSLEVFTKLRTENARLEAQKRLKDREHKAKVEEFTECLKRVEDSHSVLLRERNEARDAETRLRSQLRAFGVDAPQKTKEEVGVLIAQTEVDFTELKMELDLWIHADAADVTLDQKSIALNVAMHLAGMFQAMALAAALFKDGELSVAVTKVDEADVFAGVVRATLMGLRLGWRYRETLREIVLGVLDGDVIGPDDVQHAVPLLGLAHPGDGYHSEEDGVELEEDPGDEDRG